MIHKTVAILGGGLAGLISANICSRLGIDTILVEKTDSLGGGNKSTRDKNGNIFDLGYHALDFNRSLITTNFFQKILRNQFHKIKLQRGIVIKNHLFPYNSEISLWPTELQSLFKKNLTTDTIIGKLDRKKISNFYGKKFTKLAFDEILRSYPSINWSLQNDGDEADFAGLVYPWFFPKLSKTVSRESEWDRFHDLMRKTQEHYILYPKKNGFQGFVDAIVNNIDMNYCKIKKNVKKSKLVINPKTKKIENLKLNNETVCADLYFWCSSPIGLSRILNIDIDKKQSAIPQKIIFGNFVFEKAIKLNFHEILVGSLEHKINRISFPGKIRNKKNNLVQIEFSFPEKQYVLSETFWKPLWLKSLKELGISKSNNPLKSFSIVSETRGVVSKFELEYIRKLYESKIYRAKGSNLVIPSFTIGPENINRVVPEVILNTVKSLVLSTSRSK